MKGEHLFRKIRPAADRIARGEQHETRHRERVGHEAAAAGKIGHHILDAGGAQPRKRDMRGKLARIGGQAHPLADPFDFGLELEKLGRSRDAGEDGMRLLGAEGAGSRQLQLEFRPRSLEIAGLGLHRYLGGPWETLATYAFRGR